MNDDPLRYMSQFDSLKGAEPLSLQDRRIVARVLREVSEAMVELVSGPRIDEDGNRLPPLTAEVALAGLSNLLVIRAWEIEMTGAAQPRPRRDAP